MTGLARWWSQDLADLGAPVHGTAIHTVRSDLERRLAEPHRRYHTGVHVAEMIAALEHLQRAHALTARQQALARIAACFHDAVYQPLAPPGDNERQSAALARDALGRLGLPEWDVETVVGLVLATQSHDLVEGTDDADAQGADERALAAAFHDADLWILSSPPDRYAEYTAQVREEYAAVPDAAFRAGRATVLRPFVERASIYATAVARRDWERRAREQVIAELRTLQA